MILRRSWAKISGLVGVRCAAISSARSAAAAAVRARNERTTRTPAQRHAHRQQTTEHQNPTDKQPARSRPD